MAAVTHDERERGPWAREVVDLLRVASGGLLFGIPLLFTMEVWWIGSYTDPVRILGVLLATFIPVFLLNRTAGFRSTKDTRLSDALIDSVEAIAVGIVLVTLLLILLREITFDSAMGESLGKIVYEATPFGLGIALAHHFIRRDDSETNGSDTEGIDTDGSDTDGSDAGDDSPVQHSDDDRGLNATLADVGAAAIGSVFIAFNIAPTDEVPMLAAAMPPLWLIGVVAASLVVSYLIVFEAGFSDQKARRSQKGILQRPITETVASYLIGLATAALMLWYFQRLDSSDPWELNLSRVVVLGLPAAVGGAAGRIAV
jgi:putative integral membrane protein (TIGR02587 family)